MCSSMGLALLDADLIRHMIFIPETQVIMTLYWELGFHPRLGLGLYPRFANWELGFPHIAVGNWDWDFILDMQILVGTLSIKTHWDTLGLCPLGLCLLTPWGPSNINRAKLAWPEGPASFYTF